MREMLPHKDRERLARVGFEPATSGIDHQMTTMINSVGREFEPYPGQSFSLSCVDAFPLLTLRRDKLGISTHFNLPLND